METLEQRLQREAREKFHDRFYCSGVKYKKDNKVWRDHEKERLLYKEIDLIIYHTISETLKEAVKVIEGEMQKAKPTNEEEFNNLPEREVGRTFGKLQAFNTAITAVEGLQRGSRCPYCGEELGSYEGARMVFCGDCPHHPIRRQKVSMKYKQKALDHVRNVHVDLTK